MCACPVRVWVSVDSYVVRVCVWVHLWAPVWVRVCGCVVFAACVVLGACVGLGA